MSDGLALLRVQFDDLRTTLAARTEAALAEAQAQRHQLDLLRREARETEATLRAELQRAIEASSVLSEETTVPFWGSEAETFEGTAANPDAQGLTMEQKQRLVVGGVTKVDLLASGAVDAGALAALLIAVREFAAQRKREELPGHYPAALLGGQYFTPEAASYLQKASRVSARMAGIEAPATSQQWCSWLEKYLSLHGPDVASVVDSVSPFHVPAPATRLHASDVTLAVAMYLESYEVALHSANSESLGKPTTRGIVVRSVLRGLPSMLSTRVLVRYRMGADASSVPGYLTWVRFREDVLEVLAALLKETETGSLGESSKVLQQFAVPKDGPKDKTKDKDKAQSPGAAMAKKSQATGNGEGPGVARVIKCYKCGAEGHKSPDCTTLPKRSPAGSGDRKPERRVTSAGKADDKGDKGAKSGPSPTTCFNCHEEGHRVAECPSPRLCRKCGKAGHDAARCPGRS